MNKLAKIGVLGMMLMLAMLAMTGVAQAQGETADGVVAVTSPAWNLSGVGAGLVSIGAGYGIGRLAASAMEGMSRQPEAAGAIQTAMIIAIALIEGFTFFALFICFRGS